MRPGYLCTGKVGAPVYRSVNGTGLDPQTAQVAGALPLRPKVPEMEGCSPVNFLGVFCFLPDLDRETRIPVTEATAKVPPRYQPRGWVSLTVLSALRVLLVH